MKDVTDVDGKLNSNYIFFTIKVYNSLATYKIDLLLFIEEL